MLKKWMGLFQSVAGASLPVTLVVVRLVLAVIFVQSGLGKLAAFSDSVAFFQSIGVPFPELNVWMSSLTEVGAGIFIGLGLATRLAAIPLIGVMVVAIVTAQKEALASIGDLIRLQEFDYILLLAVLVGGGSGRFGVDAFLSRWLKKDTLR